MTVLTGDDVVLEPSGCRDRQARLLVLLEEHNLDAMMLTDPREIYYFTSVLLNPAGRAADFPAMLQISRNGSSWLVCHTNEGEAVVDERLTYEPALMATMNPDPMARLNEVVAARIGGGRSPKRVGYQAESMPFLLADTVARVQRPGAWVAFDDALQLLQKQKQPDEIRLLRHAIQCSLAAYDAASEAIAPGVSELEIEEIGHKAATLHGEEIVFHNGDYRCGSQGGFARNRRIDDGELYVIDAWTQTQGYWSDLCRTFAVGKVTSLQREVFDHIAGALADVQEEVRPGVTGDALWRFLDARLRDHPHLRENGLVHHAGHGIGLRAHEAPDLNRDRGGLLEPGDVICVEPGAYSAALRGGIRLENTFLVTEDGAELLSDYPLQLN